MTRALLSILAVATVVFVNTAQAQITTGTPPFGSFGGGPDVIDLANLNLHLTVPVIDRKSRGKIDFYYYLT